MGSDLWVCGLNNKGLGLFLLWVVLRSCWGDCEVYC